MIFIDRELVYLFELGKLATRFFKSQSEDKEIYGIEISYLVEPDIHGVKLPAAKETVMPVNLAFSDIAAIDRLIGNLITIKNEMQQAETMPKKEEIEA